MADDNDFFEEDEPTEKIRAAWKRGKKGRTGLPRGMKQRAAATIRAELEKDGLPLEPEWDVASISITRAYFGDAGPMKFEFGKEPTLKVS
ncbi:MAG: hypothetical protein ACRDWA_07570 [Acidimicrobiia bacterium]